VRLADPDRRANDGLSVDAAEPGCGSKYEPAFRVAHPADPRPRTLPSGVRPTSTHPGSQVKACSQPPRRASCVDRVLAKYSHVIDKLADGRSCGKPPSD